MYTNAWYWHKKSVAKSYYTRCEWFWKYPRVGQIGKPFAEQTKNVWITSSGREK